MKIKALKMFQMRMTETDNVKMPQIKMIEIDIETEIDSHNNIKNEKIIATATVKMRCKQLHKKSCTETVDKDTSDKEIAETIEIIEIIEIDLINQLINLFMISCYYAFFLHFLLSHFRHLFHHFAFSI